MKLTVLTALMAAALLAGSPVYARQASADAAPGSRPAAFTPPIRLAQQTPLPPAKDQQQVPATPSPPAPSATPESPSEPPAGSTAEEGGEDFSMGDIPVVETIELTTDVARRALDAYVLVSDKYKDAALENYENLQDFVDQAPQGKAFEADIKAAGFATVNEWNTAITTLSFAAANISDAETNDIRLQIEELKTDTEMAQDMRDRMIAALNAMIPSENNKKVVAELKQDPAYAEKLKLLETEEAE